MKQTGVLISGAGPTGLNLALSLARRKAAFRIVSEAAGPGQYSRAMAVQARTLEFYDQMGFAQEVIAGGVKVEASHLLQGGEEEKPREVATFRFEDLGGGITPYPFALAYPQDDHERLLLRKLEELGAGVEWNTRVTGFAQDAGGVRVSLEGKGGAEQAEAQYVCGCDGAHSKVRESMGVGFPGGTYTQQFFVADVKLERAFERDMFIRLGEHVLVLLFPVRGNGMQRLIGLVPPELSGREDVKFEDVRARAERQLGIVVTHVDWFSVYRVHHRVAEHFQVGRAFLLGDAGHIHSPVGGQGMNTGIGDAVNLGWKLAEVLDGKAPASLLESYEPERIEFARALVSTTDRVFTPLVADDLSGEVMRRVIAPLVFSVATRLPAGKHAVFNTLSQARIHYPESPLSEGKAGHVQGGDRLPWLGEGGEDNFAALRTGEWQVHVFGKTEPKLEAAARELGLALHGFAWDKRAKAAGFAEDAAYVVRPDGYVGLAMAKQEEPVLREYGKRHGLRWNAVRG